ncbi:unnamed protein product [Prorocentrum cordatum]|uniref:Uncharacterized protein n=1 Tax=Prorocentrum cordatum TaxID=2364126 RepID=A0ABN9QHR1_9DINO|nr:unnamed protein product [Polarella glacialis]
MPVLPRSFWECESAAFRDIERRFCRPKKLARSRENAEGSAAVRPSAGEGEEPKPRIAMGPLEDGPAQHIRAVCRGDVWLEHWAAKPRPQGKVPAARPASVSASAGPAAATRGLQGTRKRGAREGRQRLGGPSSELLPRMALQRSGATAIVLLLAFTPHACAAAPSSGEVAQAFVGPDGARALAQPAAGPLSAESRAGVGGVATVAVDAQGNSFQGEVAASVLLAGGSQQLPAGHSGYQQPAAPGYSSGRPAYPSSGVPPGAHAPVHAVSASSVPASSGSVSSHGPACLVPMWSDEEYACKDRGTWTSRGARSWTRSIRIEMPDGTRCTVTPPGKWSFWMASEVAEMMCKAGVWVDGKGKPVLEIEMKTAQWFLIASAVTACVLAYLLYKMFYDTESSWYTWRQDQAVKWGFATAPPPPAEDADGAASASGPQAGINISISNASGSQPAPEAKPQ